MKSRQRGVALLVVLLILALMVTVAASIAERQGKVFMRTDRQLGHQQAKWYALGAEAFVGKVILRDALTTPERTTLSQNWAQHGRQFPVEGGEILGYVQDGLTCFNLNALNKTISDDSTPYPAQVFRWLLINLGVDPAQAVTIVAAVRDWIDEDSQPMANGAEDETYMAVPDPYRAANQSMVDISELRMVQGVDAALYQRLLTFVCALPTQKLQININTLRDYQAPLLSALFLNTLNAEQAKTLLQQRPVAGWQSGAAFLAQGSFPNINKSSAQRVLVAISDWFFAHMRVRMGESGDVYQTSLLHRDGKTVSVVRRYSGGYRTVNP
ncbi:MULTISPECIES: type II secretion system minor pseudopilin GspK [Symbiopectobacterium]|uniref:type II secretion system minor pseudopilin GspK n=1 Tax=Symbiopectobacterium TaxID=801 RepID=UPI001A2BAAC6|nr:MULTISPECIES: type II secretion system minor pseudopilin GspK [Symbiopectobacterium]MBG6246769.1 general secretion pathway protein GspK [Candidatus Symbiopectobacterium sp. PLON1]MBT9429971.1 type II secretion system minor pseudopilin GspK [Candidatus Symbiopectobacterium endolongispinus]